MLPSERPTGRFRRLLHYFGLANATEENLRRSGARAAADPAPRDDQDARALKDARREAAKQHAHTALVYFGLAEDPDRSRYGDVSSQLDTDLEALRARVAKLEAQLAALNARPGDR